MATREQLIEGVKRAADAGDIEAANEIAAMLEKMDREAELPPTPSETYTQGVARRYKEADFAGIAGEYRPELIRRLAITPEGTGTDISRVPATAISQAARTGGELIMEAGSVVLPDVVREFATESYEGLMQTGYGRAAAAALSMGAEAYMEWKEKNPAQAEELETVIDVATVLSPRPDLINLDIKANEARRAGESASSAKKRVALTSLVQPEKLGARDRKEKSGILNTERWVPNAFEEDIITTLQNTSGIKPYGTVHDNFRAIQNAIDSEKAQLDNYIKSQNRKIDLEDLNIEFIDALKVFTESDVYKLASGPAKKQFDKYVKLARDIINSEGTDLIAVLRSRRRFDKAVHDAGQSLDADVATYQAEAAKLVRGVLNGYLKRNTEKDTVHNLLDLQFKQLLALDRMVNKRNREGENAVARFKQRLTEGTGVTMPATVLSVLATGTTALDPVVGGALAAAAAGTLVGQQIRRHGKKAVLQTYAFMLSATDRLIKNTNDPLRIKALEADRQVYVSLLEDSRQFEENQDEEE
jgi:hypothetical protein